MSGGEPSSIKRSVSCAAASLHTYVPDLFCENMEYMIDIIKSFALKVCEGFKHGAAAALAIFYGIAAVFLITPQPSDDTKLALGIIMAALVFLQFSLAAEVMFKKTSEKKYAFLDEHDRELIGDAFKYGSKKKVFYTGMRSLLQGNDPGSALKDFQSLLERNVSDHERCVLKFFISVCYARMGYPSHSGRFAREAADEGLGKHRPEALLLAARSYAVAQSYEEAEECYERVCEYSRRNYIFPFSFKEAADVYIFDNKPDEAVKLCELSLAEGLCRTECYGLLALCSILKKDIPGARDWFRAALLNSIPDYDGFVLRCEKLCRAQGLSPDVLFEEQTVSTNTME